MKCFICEEEIKNYNREFNQLKINDSKTVDICTDCVQKIIKWQQKLFTKLFPTSAAKKWASKKIL